MEGRDLICERLDRGVANSQWCAMFQRCKLTHGHAAYSDHIPIILNAEGLVLSFNRGKKPFHFEALWMGSEGCSEIIKETWDNKGGDMQKAMQQMRECGDKLRRWNKVKFGHVQTNLRNAQTELVKLQESDLSLQKRDSHNKACQEVQTWLEKEELM